MSATSAAFYTRLANDSTLTDLLSVYNGSPAIFTTVPVPADAELPYLVTEAEVSTTPFDTKTTLGREVLKDIRCYVAKSGSAVLVETIAERVRFLFHQYALPLTGFDNAMLCLAQGLSVAPEEDDVYGRIVTVRFIAMES